MSYCLLGIAFLLLITTGMTCRREQTHARSECSAAVCGSSSPLTSVLTKYLTKQSKFLPAMTGPFLYPGKSPTPNMNGKVIPAASKLSAIYGTLSAALSYVPNVVLSGEVVSGAPSL